MKNKNLHKIFGLLLCAALLFSSIMGADSGAHHPTDSLSCTAAVTSCHSEPAWWAALRRDSDKPSRDHFPQIPAEGTEKSVYKDIPEALIPGGMPFGVKFTTDGVLVVGISDVDTDEGKISPAKIAGLQVGDVIKKIDDTPLYYAETLMESMNNGGGKPFTLTIVREGRTLTLTVTPKLSQSENKYKSGIWIRDSGAGIGTVTFIDPSNGMFAGLGHGICDADTGALIPLHRGQVLGVTISGIVRGLPGTPGEIKGYFNTEKLGSVFDNTDCGIYGLLTDPPTAADAIPVAGRTEVKEGEAEVLCSLDTGKVSRYTVRISGINREATSNKCFTVTVTDPALLEKTGGIIQGMSGSPLVQNGKLIGAVTHVCVNL